MKNVHVKRVFTLSLTADDWALYGDNDGRLTAQRNAAALELNRAAQEALNSGDLTLAGVQAAIEEALEKHSGLGAADTEGYSVMHDLLAMKGESK